MFDRLRKFLSIRTSAARQWWLEYDVAVNSSTVRLVATVPGIPAGATLGWADIKRIDAFKRDLLSTDLVCLAIHAESGNIEVNEEMPGWDAFTAQAAISLPGLVPRAAWAERVLKPAFRENREVIFARHAV